MKDLIWGLMIDIVLRKKRNLGTQSVVLCTLRVFVVK